jgi:hypothetical protein
MLVERDVTGAAWIGAAGATAPGAVLPTLVEATSVPAVTPPVLAAQAVEAPVAAMVTLQKTALSMRTRKATTSFFGLRG